jgi:hypothetical protein
MNKAGIPYYICGVALTIAGFIVLGLTLATAPIFPAIFVGMVMILSFCIFIVAGVVFYLGWKRSR